MGRQSARSIFDPDPVIKEGAASILSDCLRSDPDLETGSGDLQWGVRHLFRIVGPGPWVRPSGPLGRRTASGYAGAVGGGASVTGSGINVTVSGSRAPSSRLRETRRTTTDPVARAPPIPDPVDRQCPDPRYPPPGSKEMSASPFQSPLKKCTCTQFVLLRPAFVRACSTVKHAQGRILAQA